MEKLQKECNEYILYSPDSLKFITDEMDNILLDKIDFYKKIFNIKKLDKIQINYFDDITKFRKYIYELRGKDTLPDYAIGTYDKGMINAYIDKNIDYNSIKYIKKLYLPCHELFHILYLKYILKNDSSKRIVWFDEGMAQYLSGEKDNLVNANFIEYIRKVKKETKEIPILNNLKHGSLFKNDKYNGYDLSYLAVRYLSETMNNDLYQLLYNPKKVEKIGQTISEDMFNYYKE